MEKKQNTEKGNSQMVSEPAFEYNITIPVTVPTMGGYTLEELTRELTEFARRLVMHDNEKKDWRNMQISNKIKKMSLGQSALSTDLRTDKEILGVVLEEKYK